MPQTIRKFLFDSTLTGSSPRSINARQDLASASIADCRGSVIRSVGFEVGAGGSVNFQVDVSAGDVSEYPPPDASFITAATRPPGGGAYATTAITVPADSNAIVHLDPADNASFMRVRVTANAGAAPARAWVDLEV